MTTTEKFSLSHRVKNVVAETISEFTRTILIVSVATNTQQVVNNRKNKTKNNKGI